MISICVTEASVACCPSMMILDVSIENRLSQHEAHASENLPLNNVALVS